MVMTSWRVILRAVLFTLFFYLLPITAISKAPTIFNGDIIRITNCDILTDSSGKLNIQQVLELPFKENVPLELSGHNTYWIRISILNNSKKDTLALIIKNPVLEDITIYTVVDSKMVNEKKLGLKYPHYKRAYNTPQLLYPVFSKKGNNVTLYIRVQSSSHEEIPIYIGKVAAIRDGVINDLLLFGIYIGIVCIMFFYNAFVGITVRDNSYFYYIFYIFFIGITQIVLNGYASKYLWPQNTWLAINAVNFCGAFSGIMTLVFARVFLNIKQLAPRLHTIFVFLILLDLLAVFITIFIDRGFALSVINFVAMLGSCFVIYCAIVVVRKGNRSARFFLIAFSVFLITVIVYVLRTKGLVEYNLFTQNILEIGSALQILLLSFALADKINIYRAEEAKAKQEALATSVENERLVRDQNTMLEQQVRERTRDLENANTSLNNTLLQLRNAQSKLVESEKMVSLGQLTAGIAHEINNPINFVTSNVKPLELDINDLVSVIDKYETLDTNQNVVEQIAQVNAYKSRLDINYLKEEIQTLLNGIKEGAQRTAEIVSNLKNFARIDEINMKYVNLNQGIDSTLMLVKNSFPKDFVINKELATIPNVECMPGKINQVFMNIITNGLQSIVERQTANPEKGILTIKTFQEGNKVKISIKDNGTGIKESVKEKLFDPFFTTKPVGHGTGLGMSIVKGIMDTHNGTIEVISNFGEGAEFIITLPVNNH